MKNMNINLQQIQYFRIVMKCSSFSQAAKITYTTQSTISKNIASLEKIIGETLFVRQKKGVVPTQRAILLNLELSEIYEKLDSLFNNQKFFDKNKITIGFCQNIAFPEIIPQFFTIFTDNDYFKDANISLHCNEVNDVVEKVINETMDLGFILSDINITNPNIKMHNIISSEPQIYFSKNCPLSLKNKLSITDFSNYPIVTTKYLVENNNYTMINSLPFTPKGIEIVESYDDIPIYLATGCYITLLRPYVSLAYISNIMTFKLPNSYGISQGITMIWFANNNNKYLKKILSIML